MSTDNALPKVVAESLIDIHNAGPGRYAGDYDYESLVFELHRTGLHVAEDDGYITLIGCLADIPMESARNERGEFEHFFPPLSARFLSDLTMVDETTRIAITINVHRVLQWRDHAKFAKRLDLALWSDLLVLSRIAPDGSVQKGTYHFCTTG